MLFLFLFLLLIIFPVKGFIVNNRRIYSSPVVKMSYSIWSDPELNWGYANGKGHDYAMVLRKKMKTQKEREEFCEKALLGEVTYDELTLVLALRFQRAAREGKDGCGKGWEIMNKLADCVYEVKEGSVELQEDLYSLIDKLPIELSNLVDDMDACKKAKEFERTVVTALCATDFLEIGL